MGDTDATTTNDPVPIMAGYTKYHTMDTAWYCGAACVQMVLDLVVDSIEAGVDDHYSRQLPLVKQEKLLKDIARQTSNDLVDWTGGPDGMETVLRQNVPSITKNYKRIYRHTKYEVEKWIAGTINLYGGPALVLTGSSRGYSHWVVVHGCLLDKEPTGEGETAAGIQGFFIHNPILPQPNKLLPHTVHTQADACGRPDDLASECDLELYHYVDIREWRRQFTPRAIPTFQGRNFIALVFAELGDERLPAFRDDIEEFQPPLDGEEYKDIGTADAQKNAIMQLDELGLLNISPWKEAIRETPWKDHTGDKDSLELALNNLASYATAYKVVRLDNHLVTSAKDSHEKVDRRWHPYYIVLINTHTGDMSSPDKAAIAVIIDAYTGKLLETMAVEDPRCNILRMPGQDEILDKINANANEPPYHAFTKVISVENNTPTWRLEDVYVDPTLVASKDEEIYFNHEYPGLVWSPSLETTSRFFPFYWLEHRVGDLKENIFVRTDTPLTADSKELYAFAEINTIGRITALPLAKRLDTHNQYKLGFRFRR